MLDEAPAHLKAEWDELYLGTNVRKTVGMKVDEKDGSACPAQPPAHPLLYHHPVTGKQVRLPLSSSTPHEHLKTAV